MSQKQDLSILDNLLRIFERKKTLEEVLKKKKKKMIRIISVGTYLEM